MIEDSVPAAEATVCTMLFSWMVESRKLRSNAIEMTAAGIEVAKVRPAFNPKNTFAAVNATVMITPRTRARMVSSVRGSAMDLAGLFKDGLPLRIDAPVSQTARPAGTAGVGGPWLYSAHFAHGGALQSGFLLSALSAPSALPLATDASDDFLGHPKGVYVCFFTEMWERFSFYGMKALLLLYLLQHHKFGDRAGLDVLGAYGGLVYCVPVIGGLLADRFLGMRKAVIFGGLLLVAGNAGMAYEGNAAHRVNGVMVRDEGALQIFYLSLALIIVGVGFLKPNISTIVGKLYADDDPRRDSGFTLFYAGINVGGLFAGLICAFLGETYGWKYGFGAAGIGMVAGLAMFLWGQKYLHGHAEPRDPVALRTRVSGLSREWWIYLGSFAGVAVVWQLIQGTSAVKYAMFVVGALFLVWFAWYVVMRCDRVQREQMLALIVIILAVLVFF